MSFEMTYDKHGVPVEAKNIELIPEEPAQVESPEPEPILEETVQIDNPVMESSEPAEEEEPELEPEPAPKKGSREANFNELREAKWQAERRARDLEEEIARMKTPIKQAEPQYSLEEDALVEGRHLSAVERKIQAMEQKLAQYEQQSASTQVEMQLKQKYPDFDSVVSADNLAKLQELYPEVAQTLYAGNDLKAKGTSAYLFIKKLGIVKEDRQATHDKVQAFKNSVKPRPVASISPQNNTSPLSKIQTFTQDTEMTPELQEHLIREMNSAIKRRGQ